MSLAGAAGWQKGLRRKKIPEAGGSQGGSGPQPTSGSCLRAIPHGIAANGISHPSQKEESSIGANGVTAIAHLLLRRCKMVHQFRRDMFSFTAISGSGVRTRVIIRSAERQCQARIQRNSASKGEIAAAHDSFAPAVGTL